LDKLHVSGGVIQEAGIVRPWGGRWHKGGDEKKTFIREGVPRGTADNGNEF